MSIFSVKSSWIDVFIFNSYDLEVYKNPLKSSILGHLDKFSDPLIQSKAPYYQGIKFKGSNSPKSLCKSVLPEIVFIFNFYDVEVYKIFLKVVYRVICSISRPFHSLKSPLYYQGSKFKCSYSPKSLHRLVLPENVIFFNLYGVGMYKMFLKVINNVSMN